MENNNYQKENDNINIILKNNVVSIENKIKENEKEKYQENSNKILIEKDKNKNELINKSNNQIKDEFKDIKSYENINKDKDSLNINNLLSIKPIKSNKKNEDQIKKQEINGESKIDNDKDNDNKQERNKILLKLLVNKELSRIRTISKELKIPIKKSNKENIDKGPIFREEQINKNEADKKINNIKDNKMEKEQNKVENNFYNKSKKKDALQIIEYLKKKKEPKNITNSFSEKNEEKNRIINININTNHNVISQNNITEIPKSKIILPNNIYLKTNNLNEINDSQFTDNKNTKKNQIFEKNKPIQTNFLNKKVIKYNKNNNLNEIMRRKKLENDLAIEINKIELSGEWYKENNNFFNNNENQDNIKTQEIVFSKENINNINYNNTCFDKNDTIQFSLNDNNNKIYSKKKNMDYNNIKYKTNYNFFKNNKIPNKNENKQINSNAQKQILNKNNNNIENINNNVYSKNISKQNKKFNIIPYNKKNVKEIIYNNKKRISSLDKNHSFEFVNNNKKIEKKKIIFKMRNSSFDNKLNHQKSKDTLNIYVKKNSKISHPEKIKKNKSVKYINKYIYNQNDKFNNYINNNNLNNINHDTININLQSLINKNQNIFIIMIEEFLVLEDMLKEIIISLNNEKYIANYCFEFWNYFYNSLLFSKFESIFKNVKYINNIKLSINLILIAIMICYDFSFESNKLINIYLFLSEILELNHKNLILILEQFSNKMILNNKENNWVIRAINLIDNYNLTEDNENLNNNIIYNEVILFKIKVNINLLMQKINYILLTNKTNFNECLIKIFNKIKSESFIYIDTFFKEYLLRENYIECSISAITFLKEKLILETESAPYIKSKNKKKFSLVLDLDETLINFKINKENNDEGVLKLRPNLNIFLENVMKYYEIILFTEASQSYSELLVNALEENKKYFEYKFYRQHTVIIGNDFIKDLTRIGRPLNSIIIIDNMPQNFRLQKSNGINIKSFFGEDDDDDKTLIDLMTILINIVKEEDDVRKGLIKYHEEIITKISSNIYKHNKY